MRKEINDLLISLQTGKICIGEAANRILEIKEGKKDIRHKLRKLIDSDILQTLDTPIILVNKDDLEDFRVNLNSQVQGFSIGHVDTYEGFMIAGTGNIRAGNVAFADLMTFYQD